MTNLVAECSVLEQLYLLKTVSIEIVETLYSLRNCTRWMEIPKTLTAAKERALKVMVRPGAKFASMLSKEV